MFNDDEDESVEIEEVAEPQIDEVDDTEIEDESEESEKEEEVAEPLEDESETEPKPKQKNDEDSKFAAARREAEKVAKEHERQAKELSARQDNFAKKYGYSTFEEMETAQEAQKYVEQGYDEEIAQKLVSVDKLQSDLQNKLNMARISEEKSKLKEVPYFKEFETEVDAILEHNPNLSVDLVFKVVKGENIDKILSTNGKAAAQKALNNINSKSHLKADGKGNDVKTVTIDEDEFKFYKGLNPKGTREEYAKFLRSQK